MRIALCFSGQPRDVGACYNSFKENIIKPNNITDIFIHIWWREEFESTGIKVGDSDSGTRVSKNILDFIKIKYNPKEMLVENDVGKKYIHNIEDIKSPNTPNQLKREVSIERQFSQYYSRYHANRLKNEYAKKHNIKYDAVIATRTDLNIKRKIKIDEFCNKCEGCKERDLSCLNTAGYRDRPMDITYLSDLMVIGNNKNINTYSDIYNHLPEISTLIDRFDGHEILGKWFMMNNITVNESCMRDPYYYTIYRTGH